MQSLLLTLVLTLPAAAGAGGKPGELSLSSSAQIMEDATAAPCDNGQRLAAARKLFERAGATSAEIGINQFPYVENISVRKQGNPAELIVVGAHYDKTFAGCGAVDNWSGVVILSHLYRALRSMDLNKTVLFEAFGREEDGLVGSKAMVKEIGEDQAPHYCAMIDLDSFGLGPPQAARNLSSDKLTELVASIAREMKIPFAIAAVPGADADSSPFIERGIPSVTLHGLNGDFRRILHSQWDQPSILQEDSIYLGYRLALAIVSRVDARSCGEWR